MFKKSLILSIALCTSAHQVYAAYQRAISGAELEAALQEKLALIAAQRAAEEAAQQAATHARNMQQRVASPEWQPALTGYELRAMAARTKVARQIQQDLAHAFALPEVAPAIPFPAPQKLEWPTQIDTAHGTLDAWMRTLEYQEKHAAAHGHPEIAIPLNAFTNYSIACRNCCARTLKYTADKAALVASLHQARNAFPVPTTKPRPVFLNRLNAHAQAASAPVSPAAQTPPGFGSAPASPAPVTAAPSAATSGIIVFPRLCSGPLWTYAEMKNKDASVARKGHRGRQ